MRIMEDDDDEEGQVEEVQLSARLDDIILNSQEEEEEDQNLFRRRLKPWSWLFLGSLPVVFGLMFLWYWQFAVVSLMLFALPSLRLFLWWRKNESFAGPLDHLISSFAQGFYLVFFVANVSASIAYISVFLILSTFIPNVLIVSGFAWSSWVALEEVWKAYFAAYQKNRRQHTVSKNSGKAWVSAATATTFGYATSQSILFACVFAAVLGSDGKVTNKEFGDLVLFAYLFGLLTMPLTILTSYLIGLELTRDTPHLTAIRWPVCLRVLYVFQFFFWFAIFATVPGGPLLSFIFIAASVYAVYRATLKRIELVEAQLPFHLLTDLRRLRRNLGFSLLGNNENDDSEIRDTELPTRNPISNTTAGEDSSPGLDDDENPRGGGPGSHQQRNLDNDDDLPEEHSKPKGAVEL